MTLPSGAPPVGPGTPPAPAPAGPTEPVVTPQQPTGSEPQDIEAIKAQLADENKRNISRLQSSLMSQQETQKRTWESEREEYERKLAEAYMSGMDEKERDVYERDLLRNRLSTMEQRLATAESQRQSTNNMMQSAGWFMQMGVKPDQLDWSSPESLAQTGTEALQSHVRDMDSKLAAYANRSAPVVPTAPVPVTPGLPAATPTPVVTTNTGTPSTTATFEDIRRSLSESVGRQLTDEDVFRMADSRPSIRQKLNELAQVDAERRALARGA